MNCSLSLGMRALLPALGSELSCVIQRIARSTTSTMAAGTSVPIQSLAVRMELLRDHENY